MTPKRPVDFYFQLKFNGDQFAWVTAFDDKIGFFITSKPAYYKARREFRSRFVFLKRITLTCKEDLKAL